MGRVFNAFAIAICIVGLIASAVTFAQNTKSGALASQRPGTTFRDCEGCPEMVVIPAGTFTMGSPFSEESRFDWEGPQHQVTIARRFAAGKFEVTRAEFARFAQQMDYSASGGCYVLDGGKWNNDATKTWRNPGFAQTDKDPVACVSWNDSKQYVEWLSRKTGKNYRLLTEAEWEYGARAGTTTAFSFGSTINQKLANYDAKHSYAGSPNGVAKGQTTPVRSYQSNAFGLYDIHGNVTEWVEDCWNKSYNGAPTDGSAWTSGECGRRVLRGGSWLDNPVRLRSALRIWAGAGDRYFYIGFRVARTD